MKRHHWLLSTLLLVTAATQAQSHHGPDRGRDRYEEPYRRRGPQVSIYATLPHGAIEVVLGGSRYHYYGGRYYRPYDRGGYIIVAPPMGLIIPSVPPGCQVVIVSGRRYYYYDDVYYVPVDRGYQVVSQPAPQEEAADVAGKKESSYEKILIDGKTYYRKDDSYYRAVIDSKGEVYYEKVGQAGS
ncbi:DUF6515 family protein [Flaviaesturariibacter terrae]